jgi:hypothetical protein
MKIIEIINKIANGEETPKKIRYDSVVMQYNEDMKDYEKYYGDLFFRYLGRCFVLPGRLNDEVEILDDEEDKDIPLIPDDELWKIENNDATNYRLNYNFKVLKEKINQVAEEFNEYRKENE